MINILVKLLFPNIQSIRASDCATLQTWAFACYRDYNAVLRHELRNLVPEFVRKY
ncbi:21481_t:CDS:1, partial [Racocetra persica]